MALVLGSIATMRTIDALREALLDELRGPGAIELDCSAIEEADLSFLQLLSAAAGQAAAEGTPFRILPEPSLCLTQLAERAGLPLSQFQPAEGTRP